jgi:3-deoxy-D-manno-octulosonic-acid transferase
MTALTLILYKFFLFLYRLAAGVFSLFNAKAEKWVNGRKDWEEKIKATLRPGEKRIWVHCSSMGEFEQARPLVEALKEQFPVYKIVVTFFSPSGYEACRKNSSIDYIFYLPHDTKRNAERFVEIIDPAIVLFIKYEFWYYYLQQLNKRQIPVLLVSGAFRKGQVFFKWYGGLFRKMLDCFTFFFLQDDESQKMLNTIGIEKNIVVSGDTRYDRVSAIAKNIAAIPAIEQFKGQSKILIAGSTWPGDEEVLKENVSMLPDNWKLIIAPHEIEASHIKKIQQLFDNEPILFSDLDVGNTHHK